MTAPHIRIGKIGEEAVANHLARKGYVLLERNYRKKWGEIDVIMKKGKTVHFIEVKSVGRRATGNTSLDTWRPEENVHPRKLQKLMRAIETWLAEHVYEGEWQIDVAAVSIDVSRKTASIRLIENI